MGLLLALPLGALYVRTAARDIVFGDSPELVGVAATLGVAHPPGYPIWTIVAHLFTLLPFGTLPLRVSLFSVMAALVCVLLLYATGLRLTRSYAASAAAAAIFALVPTVWTWAIVPEVFALASALAAALMLLVLLWHQTGEREYFVVAAFVAGLGMAHQQTIALLAPAILYLMWQHRSAFRGGALLVQGAIAAVAGLAPYVYLPIAASQHPAWNWSEISSLPDLVAHVLRADYGTGILVADRFQGGPIADRLLSLGRSFTIPEAALIAIGSVAVYRRDRTWFWVTAVAAIVAGPAFIAYSNTNLSIAVLQVVLERFFLLTHVVLAPVGAVGVVAIASGLASVARARPRVVMEGVAATIAIAGAMGIAAANFGTIDQSANDRARQFGEDILGSIRPDAILLEGGDPVIGTVDYLHLIEGARPDVTYIDLPLLKGPWYVRQLRRVDPTLVLQYDTYDGIRGTMRALVESNGVERFDIIGVLLDDSLAGTYGLYRRGLLEELRLRTAAVDVDQLARVNDAALRGYHIPPVSAVAGRPWDRAVLTDYSLVATYMGDLMARVKRPAEARMWYQRALLIEPNLAEAQSGLAALPP